MVAAGKEKKVGRKPIHPSIKGGGVADYCDDDDDDATMKKKDDDVPCPPLVSNFSPF
jgi:hypothetical protein